MALNVTTAVFGENCNTATASPSLAQWDTEQVLQISGIDLPDSYKVEFSTVYTRNAIPVIGDASGVTIPNVLLQRSAPITAYVVLYGENGGRNREYWITIHITPGQPPETITPDPEQEDVIDQAIAALNNGVARTEAAAGEAEAASQAVQDMGVEAETLAAGSAVSVEKTVDPETGAVTLNFGIPKGDTGATGPQGPQGVQGPKGNTGDPAIVYSIEPSVSAVKYNPNAAVGSKFTPRTLWLYTYKTVSGVKFQSPVDYLEVNDGEYTVAQENTSSISESLIDPYLGPATVITVTAKVNNAVVAKITVPIVSDGATGPQGPKGDTGATGPQGPQGPKGDAGASDAGDVTYDHTENYQSGTAGAALNDLSRQLSDVDNKIGLIYHETNNLYDATLDVPGSLRDSDGAEVDSDTGKRSPIIYFNGNNITLSKATATDTLHGAFKVGVYNQDGTLSRMLQYATGSAVTSTITPIKDNTRDEKYIKIVSLKNAVQYMVNYGDTLLDYEIPEDRFIFSSECDFVASMHRLDAHYDPITYKGLDGRSGSEPDFNYNTVTAALLYAKIDAVMAEFPDYITKTLLGYDQSGTLPIYEYDLFPSKPEIAFQDGNTYNGGKDYPTVLITSGMHGYGAYGDPPLMPYVIYNFIYDICHNWKQNEVLAYYRQKVKLAIIPISNPWGFNNKSRLNSRGVDINRNFDYNWAAGEPGSTNYGGTAPFSEAETKILRDFISKYPTAICHTDFHSTGRQTQNHLLYVSINEKSDLYYTVYDYISEMSRYWDNDNLPGWEDIEYHGRVVVYGAGINAWTERVRLIPSVIVESFMNYEGSGYTTNLNDVIVKMAYEQIVCWLSHLIRYRVTMLNPYK